MARSLNKVMLIGNLGKDPEMRYTPAGVPVASFSMATSESWRDQDGNTQERTEWHNIVAWRKLAEICAEYLKKGKKVYIEGRIQTRSFDDKNTGQKRYMTEIVADNMIMLDSGGMRGGEGAPERGRSVDTQATGSTSPEGAEPGKSPDDDLPF
jgi:single-strand DNA-binding protein